MEMSKQMYKQIIQLELTFLDEFKMNSFELFQNMSVKDMTTYMMAFTTRLQEKNKKKSKYTKDLSGALASIRDVLNYMYS